MIETREGFAAAAAAWGLDLSADGMALDTAGPDFTVAHAVDREGMSWVLQSPRREDACERAAREGRALEMVRPHLPVSVPEWRLFTPELIAYPRIPGEPAAVVDPGTGSYAWRFDPAPPPETFLESLSRAIAALHHIDPAAASRFGLPVQSIDDIRATLRRDAGEARRVLQVPDTVWDRWARWLADDSFWPVASVVIHGDLRPSHLLLDEEHRVVGILDWAETRVGDPASDFAPLYGSLGRSALRALLESYRVAGGHVWPRMEQHVVETWSAYPIALARLAMESGDDAPRQLAQTLVDQTARQTMH